MKLQQKFTLVDLANELEQQLNRGGFTSDGQSHSENQPSVAEMLKSRTNQFSKFINKFERDYLEINSQSEKNLIETLNFYKGNLKNNRQYAFDKGSIEFVKFVLYFDGEVPRELALSYKRFKNMSYLSDEDKKNLVVFYNQHLLSSISMPEQARYQELNLFAKTFNFNEEYLDFIFESSKSNDLELFFSTSLEQQKKKLISMVETLPPDKIILTKLLYSLFQSILLESSITVISDMSDDDQVVTDMQAAVITKIEELVAKGLSEEDIRTQLEQIDFHSKIDQEHPFVLFFESYDQLKKKILG